MAKQDLVARLYQVACQSLALANSKSVFVADKKQAMYDINRARRLMAEVTK